MSLLFRKKVIYDPYHVNEVSLSIHFKTLLNLSGLFNKREREWYMTTDIENHIMLMIQTYLNSHLGRFTNFVYICYT